MNKIYIALALLQNTYKLYKRKKSPKLKLFEANGVYSADVGTKFTFGRECGT